MKNRIITTIIAITIIMSTLFTLTSVNTSALVVVGETPAPTADVTAGVTGVPTVNTTATVEPTPTPTAVGHPVLGFTIDQKTIYPEKTIITGALDNNYDYKFIVKVNGIEFKTIIVPKSEDGKFSMELDFSDCNVGDKVTFTAYLADGFVVSPSGVSFHLERRPLKTPRKTAIKKIKKLGKGKMKVVLKKVKNVSGYKVSCATNKKFKGKGIKVKTAKNNTVVIKGLKAGKYFVKAQTYNALKGSKTKYSKASKIKKFYLN